MATETQEMVEEVVAVQRPGVLVVDGTVGVQEHGVRQAGGAVLNVSRVVYVDVDEDVDEFLIQVVGDVVARQVHVEGHAVGAGNAGAQSELDQEGRRALLAAQPADHGSV